MKKLKWYRKWWWLKTEFQFDYSCEFVNSFEKKVRNKKNKIYISAVYFESGLSPFLKKFS